MSNTTTATATTDNGPVQIEIQIPDANRAAEWNAAIAAGAAKAGVELPGVTATPAAAAVAATTDASKKVDEPTIYRATLNVNGTDMVFEDADASKVLAQYTAAVEAAKLSPAPAAITPQQMVEAKKGGLDAAKMFDVGTRLIGGDATALDELIVESGAIGRYLEKEGISIEQLKAATQKTQTDTVHDAWTSATTQFLEKVKAGEVDYPGGNQNMKLMGITLAQLGLKPSVDSMVKAWDHIKKEGLAYPVEKKDAAQEAIERAKANITAKTAPSSTAIGANGAGKETPQQQTGINPSSKFEIDMTTLSPEEAARTHRELLARGVKPEQIVVKT